MTTTMIALTAMVLFVYLLPVQGGNECQLKGKGKLKQFNAKKVNVRIPCKFHATTFFCEGYRIHVAPGVALDSKNRYYTTSAWIEIKKDGTDFLWAGRTSDMRLARIFNGTNLRPFKVKKEEMEGAPFKVRMTKNPTDHSVTLKVSDAKWKIYFNGYDPDDRDLRRANGIKIVCKEPVFDPMNEYPVNLCGNGTDEKAVSKAKRSRKMPDRTATIIYNVLETMPHVKQTSDLCKSAGSVFEGCDEGDRSKAVQTCSPLLSNPKILRYMSKFNLDPMQEFLSCLKYRCNNDLDSCDLVQDHMSGSSAFTISCPRG